MLLTRNKTENSIQDINLDELHEWNSLYPDELSDAELIEGGHVPRMPLYESRYSGSYKAVVIPCGDHETPFDRRVGLKTYDLSDLGRIGTHVLWIMNDGGRLPTHIDSRDTKQEIAGFAVDVSKKRQLGIINSNNQIIEPSRGVASALRWPIIGAVNSAHRRINDYNKNRAPKSGALK